MSETASALHQLAEAAGIRIDWVDNDDCPQRVSDDTLKTILAGLDLPADSEQAIADSRRRLDALRHPRSPAQWPPLVTARIGEPVELPSPLPPGTSWTLIDEQGEQVSGQLDAQGGFHAPHMPGYYRFEVDCPETADSDETHDSSAREEQADHYRGTLAVAPERAFMIEDLNRELGVTMDRRRFGLTAQLYGLRREGDGGLGDTAALAALTQHAAAAGADAVAISPVHALFAHAPERISPYSPSSRLAFNALHGAPDQLLGEAMTREAFELDRTRLEDDVLIDYPRVAAARWRWLRRVFDRFAHARGALDDHRLKADFARFRREQGRALEDHCCFEALCAHYGDPEQWPEALRDINSRAVHEFVVRHGDEIAFHAFTQWLMARGLSRAQQTARDAGMAIGIIADIAVGVSPSGSQAWSRPTATLTALGVGAPPDAFNQQGQNWGVAGFSPQGLVREGFATFIDTLRAAFVYAGGVRLDHIMGLSRLWLVPHDASPADGAYVHQPEQDLLRLVALESWRYQAIVIGEDLGTVDPEFRRRLTGAGIYGMRVLWFEREDDDAFTAPQAYDLQAVAMTSTHDLPTVAGWWTGNDIDRRTELGLVDNRTAEEEQRRSDRRQLAEALAIEESAEADTAVDGAIRLIARSASQLALVQLEDLLGDVEQANLPGTLDEHPNWRRRQPPEATRLAFERTRARLEILHQARGGSVDPDTLRQAYRGTDPKQDSSFQDMEGQNQ